MSQIKSISNSLLTSSCVAPAAAVAALLGWIQSQLLFEQRKFLDLGAVDQLRQRVPQLLERQPGNRNQKSHQ